MSDILIIGAGLAGLAAASDLQAAGVSVTVLDKGRGVGGRAATRRFAGSRVDHGAQFFTARSARFQALVAQGLADGWVREWYRTIPEWHDGTITARPEGHPRYTCPDGMSALPKALAQNLTIHTEQEVAAIERTTAGYTATTRQGATFSGTTLLLNLPPVQLLRLAGPLLAPDTVARLERVTLEPCWALLAALATDLAVDWPALELSGHPVFSWLARDHTRRPAGAPPVLVAHASPAWTETHLEQSAETVRDALSAALEPLLGPVRVTEATAHRWRFARPVAVLGAPYLWDAERRIGACGDWCEGGRVEGALLSGWALAAALAA